MEKTPLSKKDIAVVIPVYRTALSKTEELSLGQCAKMLSDYDIIFVKPEHLDITSISQRCRGAHEEAFPDEWFVSRRAYNRMVLEESFYRRFEKYEYILIYQLDAFVFRDELLEWARKGYDYIGAPWLPLKERYLTTAGRIYFHIKAWYKKHFNPRAFRSSKYHAYEVGNGGLSLRKVSTMVEITRFYREKIQELLVDDREFYAEDVFLLRELDNKRKRKKKPSWREAIHFAIEECPAWAYRYNRYRLPFGCHAFDLKEFSDFWKPFIHSN